MQGRLGRLGEGKGEAVVKKGSENDLAKLGTMGT